MTLHRPSPALGAALAASAAHATDAATRAANAAPPSIAAAARPLGCLIEPDRVADLGSQVIGVVDQVRVERGDRVDEGQVLATLRSEVENASARAAQTRAQVDADVLAARANVQLAEQKKNRAEALVAQNFVSEQAAEQARGELEVARQRLAQAESQQQISRDDLRVAQAQRALRILKSPFAGVVKYRLGMMPPDSEKLFKTSCCPLSQGHEVFAEAPLDSPLSEREQEVLSLIATGSTNKEIAGHLHLSPHTVKEHTSAIYRKLGVRNRAEATRQAQRLKILV